MGSAHLATPWRNIDEGKLAETRGFEPPIHVLAQMLP
jgi:hypothetical protein